MPARSLTDARWQLRATEEIKRLKARYFATLDAKRWDEFGALFTPDCEFITYRLGSSAPPKRRCGPEEIVASVRRSVDAAVTVHCGHLVQIEFHSPEEASQDAAVGDYSGAATWEMTDYVEFPDYIEFPDGKSRRILQGTGHYYEQYRLRDERWLISRLELRRVERGG